MATEAEFKSGSGIQHALMFHKRAIVVLDVTHAVVIPCIRASDTDIRDDAEYTLVVEASKAVEHVPCDFKVHIGIFHFFPQIGIFIVQSATLSSESESEIRREPMANAYFINCRCFVNVKIAIVCIFFKQWHLCACAQLDVPIVAP